MKSVNESPTLQSKTIPAAFLERAKKGLDIEFYFTKRAGQWKGRSYREALEFIYRSLAGLKTLGIKPGDRVAILAENREEWILSDLAIQWMGAASVGIYTTSSEEQIRYILNESQSQALFVSSYEMAERISRFKGLDFLKSIIAFDYEAKPSSDGAKASPPGAKPSGETARIIGHSDFLKDRVSEQEADEKLASLDENALALLLYTSGTTGDPKGVMLSHKNFVSDFNAMLKCFHVDHETIALSFLPFSHIYERSVHLAIVMAGVQVYFAESLEALVQNLQEVRPHFMTAVPRIFEKMYARIQEKSKNASLLQKMIFHWAMNLGHKKSAVRLEGTSLSLLDRLLWPLADFLVFRKVRAITGGRSRIFISGGAPLSREIGSFFFGAGFTILEGYGLSETCILSCNREHGVRLGTVGQVFPGVEVKIASDGEILARGPMIMKGYFNKPEATAEVMDSEGWFHTGDIGEIDPDGYLKITDRKKDLIILAAGKKIAPQPLENHLKKDVLIESVCLIGDNRSYVVALVVPNLELARSWGQQKGFRLETLADCVANHDFVAHFQKLFDELNAHLPRYSTIKYFRLLSTPFTIEGGELTPTLKLKRRVIQEKFKETIREIYDSSEQLRQDRE